MDQLFAVRPHMYKYIYIYIYIYIHIYLCILAAPCTLVEACPPAGVCTAALEYMSAKEPSQKSPAQKCPQ